MEIIPEVDKTVLPWDGSFLGTYGVNCVKGKVKTDNKLTFTTIHTKAFEITCILRRPTTPSIVCILDELKECFGIRKMGTHRIQIGNTIHVMIKCDMTSFLLTNSFKVSVNTELKVSVEDGFDEAFKAEMRKLICYRLLLRIPNINNKSFLVVNESGRYTPYSFVEVGVYMNKPHKPPTRKFLERWFGDRDISEEIVGIVPKKTYEEWSEFLLGFRDILSNKIHGVDPECVWLTSFIIEKMIALY